MNMHNPNQGPGYNPNVIGGANEAKKQNGFISNISNKIKSKLIQTLGIAGFLGIAMTGASGKANATIIDCANKDCIVALEDTKISFYDAQTGIFEGSVTDGNSGDGSMTAKNGIVTSNRFSGSIDTTIVNTVNGSHCSTALGSGGTEIMNDNIYITNTGTHKVHKLDKQCIELNNTDTGQFPWGITTDGSFLYTANQGNGDLTQIDPITMDSTNINIGGSFFDELCKPVYHAGTNALYISSADGIKKIELPSYTSTNFQTLPNSVENTAISNTHILTESTNSDAYAIPISNPSGYHTLNISSPGGVAINNGIAYVSNGSGIEKFDINTGASLGQFNTTAAWNIAYLPAQNPVTDICDGAELTGSEVCDGTFLNGQDCVSQGFDGGTLACASDCATFDTSGCANETCGDNTTNGTDVCDGSDLNGNDCTTIGQGFITGTLACNTGCDSYDTTSCVTQVCGDGNIDGTEACDGTNVNNETCITLGYASGTLACAPGCDSLNTAGCVPEADCGNGTINDGEVCDGTNLNETTCETLGYASGDLTCKDSCAEFDETGCEDAPDPVCGNDITEAGEDCDDGNIIDGDGCSATCTTEVEVCEFTDDTELTIETAEDTQQVDTSQLVGILLDRYNGNLEDLQRECNVECIMDPIVDIPIIQITTPDGSYCNFKLVTGEKGDTFYNEQIYQLHDVNVGDGEGAVLGFNRESSYNSALDAGGLILVHSGRQVKTNIVSALGGGTLGTVVAYELHAEHEGVQAEWVQLVIGDGGIRFSHPDTPDEYRDVYFDDDTEGAEPVVIWLNLTEFNKSRNLDESLFPINIRDPKNPNWWGCSTSGDQSPEGSTGMLALSMFIATGLAAWRKKKKNGEIVDDDVV